MDPVDGLARSLAYVSLDSPSTKASDVQVQQLFASFLPFIGSQNALAAVREMSLRDYYRLEPAVFFTAEEAKKIAEVIACELGQNRASDRVVISRKQSKADWKVIVLNSKKTVLLLPRKGLFHDLVGHTKRGRVALECSHDRVWQVRTLWNLTRNAERAENFIRERFTDTKLQQMNVSQYFQKCLYDLDGKTDAAGIVARSCYYERLKCLFLLRDCLSLETIQKVALGVAQIVEVLHKKEIGVVDLKSENILLTNEYKVLFCDVGQLLFDAYVRKPEHGGTVAFYPPELLQPEYAISDTKGADIFAFGCLLLELLSGIGPPWMHSAASRRFDAEMLGAYRKCAMLACLQLTTGADLTAQERLLYIAQWALHPVRTGRPSMQAINALISKNKNTNAVLDPCEFYGYLQIEQQNRAEELETPPPITGNMLYP